MPPKQTLELSEVQKKVIEELDVLTDAFVSTFKELGKIIKTHSKDISELTDYFIKKNKSWKLQRQCWDLLYYPFRDRSPKTRGFRLEDLQQKFCVNGRRTLEKKSGIDGREQHTKLTIEWGFKYDNGYDPFKFFYVWIEIPRNSHGVVLTEDEYESIGKSIKETIGIKEEYFYDLDYDYDEGNERFYVWLDYIKYSEKVFQFFKICKDELIEKFISKVK